MFKKTKAGEGAIAEAEIHAEGPGDVEAAEAGSSLRRLARAVSLHMKGEREEALKVLDGAEADADANDLAEITAARGHIQLELNRHEDAAASYARLAKIRPDSAEIRFSLGLCLQNLGRYAEAVESFRAALPLGGKQLDTQLAIGACLLHLNKQQEAREAFDAALVQAPEPRCSTSESCSATPKPKTRW
jgi:tetratricopeptide (TPR) repeat protein